MTEAFDAQKSLPVRRRATDAPHRGGAHCRYELVQCLGGVLCDLAHTRPAYLEHEKAKAELKSLVPEDALSVGSFC
jgi:hypothetical protein